MKDVEAYTKAMVTLQPLTPTLCPFGGLMITLSEKPTLEFDVDLPLGLEGTVWNAIQEWLETLVENILETTLVWPERLVVPIADPEMPVTLPDGSTRTHEWYVENRWQAGRRVGVPAGRARSTSARTSCRKPTRACAPRSRG